MPHVGLLEVRLRPSPPGRIARDGLVGEAPEAACVDLVKAPNTLAYIAIVPAMTRSMRLGTGAGFERDRLWGLGMVVRRRAHR